MIRNDRQYLIHVRPSQQIRQSLPHVVIVGAGFGGLEAARALGRKPVRVTVVDRRNHHLFQPLLYQVATAGLSGTDITSPMVFFHERQGIIQNMFEKQHREQNLLSTLLKYGYLYKSIVTLLMPEVLGGEVRDLASIGV